jgi:metallophosphoesterase (TIGR03768 family)
MKREEHVSQCALVLSLIGLLSSGCNSSEGNGTLGAPGYPIDSTVVTTALQTIAFPTLTAGLQKYELSQIARYADYGYGAWTPGPGLASDPRFDLMPPTYASASVKQRQQLLHFFTFTDIHITDKESPSQVIYLQQMYYPDLLPAPYNALGDHPWSYLTSAYSPVMLYSTQVLDAAVQTVNALHKLNPIDFGISLGDTCNSTQYNELRWYIDVLDGKLITPSSGAHAGAESIDYQKPFQAAGLDKAIPWYQTLGNHDHFWIGSLPVDDFLRNSLISDTVLAAGDVLYNYNNFSSPEYYMGVLDGSTPNGDIIGAGPVGAFSSPPKVVADPDRRSLQRTEWMKEFFTTSSSPIGHGFAPTDAQSGFACYSFVPKSDIPIKVIVLDDTQRDDDGDAAIHGHGFLDQERYDWLKGELASGDAANQLMIVAAHVPIGVEPSSSKMGWWLDARNAVTVAQLIEELEGHPNLLMWIAGHRHYNTVKAFVSADPVNAPEKGFWQVETSSLRDFPQQFRDFEIQLNDDYTIAIVATDVDPAVKAGTPAATSREYAVAAQQIVSRDLSPNLKGADPTVPGYPGATDPSIKSMLPSNSYNATLYKQLSPTMVNTLKAIFPAM